MTSYRNAVLIFNPRAGKFGRRGGRLLHRGVEILKRNGLSVTVVPTTGPGTAGPIARERIDSGADLIIAAGGDGTINEVAEGMVHSPVPLAILPGGTANVMAMEMKLGSNLERVAAQMAGWSPRRIAVGRLTCDAGRRSRHFLLMAGIGLDAHIVYHVSGAVKARVGKFAYWVAGWSLLGRRLPQMHVEIDGHRGQCSFALLSRVRNYGGDFEIARNIGLFEDRFEVVLFEGRSTFRYAKYFTGMVMNRLVGMSGVTVIPATHVKLSCPEDRRIYIQVDGELAGRLPAEIEIVPDALTLMVPPGYSGK